MSEEELTKYMLFLKNIRKEEVGGEAGERRGRVACFSESVPNFIGVPITESCDSPGGPPAILVFFSPCFFNFFFEKKTFLYLYFLPQVLISRLLFEHASKIVSKDMSCLDLDSGLLACFCR